MPRMSSFDIAAIISELRGIINHAWISNIYHLGTLFTIKFRTKEEGAVELVIEPQKRIHLTKYKRPKPRYPSKFCMTLRKYLRNRRVLEIKQYKFDRVVILDVGRFILGGGQEIQNKLIIEFFERGNLVLLDSEGKVIVALNYRTMRDRRIIPNRDFSFAPPRGIDIRKVVLSDLKNILKKSNTNLVSSLIANLNIGPLYAQEICFRSGLDKERDPSGLSKEDLADILINIRDLVIKLHNNEYNPRLYQINSKSYLAPLELLQFANKPTQQYEQFNEAADEFFSLKEEIRPKNIELKDKKSELNKTEKILKNQKIAIQRLERDSVRFRRLGDILYQYFREIEQLLFNIKKARDGGHSWDEIQQILRTAKEKNITPAQYVKKINYKNASLILNIEKEEFTIDFRKSVAENATKFYSKAKKAVSKLSGAKKAYQKMLKQKDKVELETDLIGQKEEKLVVKRKKRWYEKFHWFKSSDDFLVIAGRDLKTNELIVKKYMSEEDIFFHATYRGAPVVVVKTEGKEVAEQTLMEAAQLGVTFSSAWKAQYGQADVYWVNAPQVSKTPPSGEYLQKGSFIIRGKRNPFKHVPLKVQVGLFFEDEFAIVMSGPPSAIQKHTDTAVEVKFGNKSNSTIAKLIKKRFLNAYSDDQKKRLIRNLPLDDIQRSLPGGKSEIVS